MLKITQVTSHKSLAGYASQIVHIDALCVLFPVCHFPYITLCEYFTHKSPIFHDYQKFILAMNCLMCMSTRKSRTSELITATFHAYKEKYTVVGVTYAS